MANWVYIEERKILGEGRIGIYERISGAVKYRIAIRLEGRPGASFFIIFYRDKKLWV